HWPLTNRPAYNSVSRYGGPNPRVCRGHRQPLVFYRRCCMFRFAVAAIAALTLVASAEAAKLKIGDPAPKFSGLESADGKSVSFEDYKNKDVLVVCITCNHCPVAVAY